MNMFEYLKSFLETQDGKVLYVLGLIAVAMCIDLVTGVISAKVNPDMKIESGKGINGVLRKLASIMVMIYFAPVSVLLPNDSGVVLLYTLYIGYLGFEVTSILENLEKMGLDIKIFQRFSEGFKKYLEK